MENIEKEYYESGALLHEYSVRDGRKHGPYRRYYESGALRMSATYRDGFMEGPEEEFFENGQLQVRRVYCHGEFVLRLRLPNDGDTEKGIARGLKRMLGI